MNKRLIVIAYAILVIPMVRPLHAQDGGFGGGDSIDVTGALNGRGGFGRGGFNRGGPIIPDSKSMLSDIRSALNKGKTPLEKSQEMPLKSMRYKEILDRGGIETLIGVEAMQNTPLNDEQIARVTAAWPEFQSQIQEAAKAVKTKLSTKELDNASTAKVLEMLEPAQVASYESARKYDSEPGAGK
jgi:hypothetical protein